MFQPFPGEGFGLVGAGDWAWLNADRGRVAGPGRTQRIYAGDSVKLRVHGKYAEPTITKLNAGTYLTQSAKDQMVDGISELAGSLQRSGSGNPIALLNLANILAGDLLQKEAPEAYLIYALYDTDSNRYEVGKQVLTKNAANQHEVLEENLYIGKDGYMETFVINETSEDVWFDDFMVMSTTSPVMQETHYGPWGLELTGIGFQYAGIKANRYLYNGKELIEDNGLLYYDYGQRMYDPTLGRFNRIDRFANKYYPLSPYSFTANNPIIYVDIQGDSLLRYLDNLRVSGGITYNTLAFKTSILGIRTGIDISPNEQYLIGYQGGFEVMGTNRNGENVRRASLSGHIMGLGASKEVVFKNEKKVEDINSIIFLDNYSGNSGSESHKSIGFGFKAGLFLGIKLNIEYHLNNRENQVIPELNYNVPGILDSMEEKNVKKINPEFGNISEQEKDKIVQFMKGYENRDK